MLQGRKVYLWANENLATPHYFSDGFLSFFNTWRRDASLAFHAEKGGLYHDVVAGWISQ